ncbi:type II 3-dehydroquinate dehydratase [Candidatus Vidania fulgoroideorum]
MKKIIIINGPNINMLGIREKKKYGCKSLKYINKKLFQKFKDKVCLLFFQSNSEEKLINKIHSLYKKIDYIVINPAGLSYNSYSLLDSILSINVKYIEVHITNIFSRGVRKYSIFSKYAIGVIIGLNYKVYEYAIDFLNNI